MGARHVDAGAVELYAFGFEQAALERAVRFGDEQASAGANNAMPRDASSAGASGHGIADRSRTSGKTQRTREFAISGDTAPGNLFYQPIDGLPGHGFVFSPGQSKNLPQGCRKDGKKSTRDVTTAPSTAAFLSC
jgi:hypothetical protein